MFVIPFCIILDWYKKNSTLRKLFNFHNDLKRVKHKMKQKNLNESNSTLLGYNGRKPVYCSDNAKHIFICGTTGSGKTVALSNYIENCMKKDFPMLIVDGKGDTGKGSILSRKMSPKSTKLVSKERSSPKQRSRLPRNSTISSMIFWRNSMAISKMSVKSTNLLPNHSLRRTCNHEKERDHEVCGSDLQQDRLPDSEEEP